MLLIHGLHGIILLAVSGTNAGFQGSSSISHRLSMKRNASLSNDDILYFQIKQSTYRHLVDDRLLGVLDLRLVHGSVSDPVSSVSVWEASLRAPAPVGRYCRPALGPQQQCFLLFLLLYCEL